MIVRRTFVNAVAASLFPGPHVSAAQPVARRQRIGVLSCGTAPGGDRPDPDLGLKRALSELGYVEGRNLIIEARYADGRPDRTPTRSSKACAPLSCRSSGRRSFNSASTSKPPRRWGSRSRGRCCCAPTR